MRYFFQRQFQIGNILNLIRFFFSVNTNSSTVELVSSGVQLISSPGYPRYYPSYAQKAFFIVAPEGYTVKLDVLDFDIRSGCSYNRISIVDGTFRILKFIFESVETQGGMISNGC